LGGLADAHAESDIESAADWITREIKRLSRPINGIYLAMVRTGYGDGPYWRELEIAFSQHARLPPESRWLWSSCHNPGHNHEVRGLIRLESAAREESLPSDQIETLLLTYSGLVLSEVFARRNRSARLVAVWGFHDGALYWLGHNDEEGFHRLAAPLSRSNWELPHRLAVLADAIEANRSFSLVTLNGQTLARVGLSDGGASMTPVTDEELGQVIAATGIEPG
jgi:hypothetical protein